MYSIDVGFLSIVQLNSMCGWIRFHLAWFVLFDIALHLFLFHFFLFFLLSNHASSLSNRCRLNSVSEQAKDPLLNPLISATLHVFFPNPPLSRPSCVSFCLCLCRIVLFPLLILQAQMVDGGMSWWMEQWEDARSFGFLNFRITVHQHLLLIFLLIFERQIKYLVFL